MNTNLATRIDRRMYRWAMNARRRGKPSPFKFPSRPKVAVTQLLSSGVSEERDNGRGTKCGGSMPPVPAQGTPSKPEMVRSAG
ncbi:MAG TPA: hypothetical protein VG347_00830 [Verrucomicrobiae bacterium]|nr:hypothetical protein [Verrucomicrobiae bacterium]